MLWKKARPRNDAQDSIVPNDAATAGLAEAPAQHSSTFEDAFQSYRLILWRDAENAEVVTSKVGQNTEDMLRGFVDSGEFRDGTAALLSGDGTTETVVGLPLPSGMADWAITFFGFKGEAATLCRAAKWIQTLTGLALAEPMLRSLVDAQFGDGAALRMAEAVKRIEWIGAEDADPSGGTTALDMRNLYLLVHDRPPENAGVAQASPNTTFLAMAVQFLASKEFAQRMIPALLGADFIDSIPLTRELRDWVCGAFDVLLDQGAGRASAIAAILRQPDIAERLETAEIIWSRTAVIAMLEAAAGDADVIAKRIAAAHLLEVGSGILLYDLSGIAADGPSNEVLYTDSDPWIRFRLSPEVTRADLVQISLSASLDGQHTTGHIYFDYGGVGFRHEDSLEVQLDEDQIGRVILANPRDLKELRWDPTSFTGRGAISMLSAEPIAVDELWEQARSRLGNEVAIVEALIHEARRHPLGTLASGLARILSGQPTDYLGWLTANEPNGDAGKALWGKQLADLTDRPLISIVMPTYNTDEALLRETIDSVIAQVYPNWELCIADDASPDAGVRAVIKDYADRDARIRYVFREKNGHISAASNSALALANGEWIALLDHDDLLRPNALLAMAKRIEEAPEAQLIYSDEDKIDQDHRRFQPYFKPDFSPEMLLAHNYLNHFSVFRAETVRKVGGWREGFEGSQDYDLNWRVLDAIPGARIEHIPEVLYHWRAIPGSTALAEDEKGYAAQAGLRALREHLDRIGTNATAEKIPDRSFYRVTHAIPQPLPAVTLIMPTRDMAKIVEVAARSILDKSTYGNFRLVIVDNDSRLPETFKLFDALKTDPRVTILSYPHPFNYSAINNFAVERTGGDIIGLVNNDIEVLTPSWIEELVSWAIQDGIGCVGAKLYYPDMTIQHAGVVVGLGGIANHIHRNAQRDDPGYFARNLVHHNVSAVTAACLFLRRSTYEEVGGLDERMQVAFNDVDFCLKVREAGYRNLFTPFAELIHHESVSRGVEDTPEKIARFAKEVAFMDEHWGRHLRNDPYYSPNFDLMGDDYALGVAPHRKAVA